MSNPISTAVGNSILDSFGGIQRPLMIGLGILMIILGVALVIAARARPALEIASAVLPAGKVGAVVAGADAVADSVTPEGAN